MNFLLNSPQLQNLFEASSNVSSLLLEGLWESPKAAVISLIQKATKKDILVLTSDNVSNQLAQNLGYFNLNHFREFPAWDTLPGDSLPPSPDIIGRRFKILYSLANEQKPQVTLCPLKACLQKLPKKTDVISSCNLWSIGEEIPFDSLDSFLQALGYQKEPVTTDKGLFSLRRGILDIFPLSAEEPLRIEFFGDEIESIRTFDPVGQHSIKKVDSVFVCPASEIEMLKDSNELSSLFDYLNEETLIIFDDLLGLEDSYVSFKGMPGASSRFFFDMQELLSITKLKTRLFLSKTPIEELTETVAKEKAGRSYYSGKTPYNPLTFEFFDSSIAANRLRHPFVPIPEYFAASCKEEILHGVHRLCETPLELKLVSASESEEKTLRSMIEDHKVTLPEKTSFEKGYLSSGFALEDVNLAILPMPELTGRTRIRRQKWRGSYHTPSTEFHELKAGDLVVHFHNGIGKYLGTNKKKNHLGHISEFLVIEYSGQSKLYVPLSSSHLVSRYIGSSEEIPTLNNLSSQKWQSAASVLLDSFYTCAHQ